MKEKPRKFETLEALRGIAALLVVWHHYPYFFGAYKPPNIFLAVDLFFGLSGFVLSYAYQAKLDAGLPSRAFLLARFIRLWPFYAFSLAGGYIVSLPIHHRIVGGLSRLLPDLLIALPFFPHIGRNPDSFLYPLNPPAWTLLMELLANVAHASLGRRVKTSTLSIALALCGLTLIYLRRQYGFLDGGWSLHSLPLGLARTGFSYMLGMFLFRLRMHFKEGLRIPSFVPCLLLAGFLTSNTPARFQTSVEVLAIGLLFPTLLLVGAWNEPRYRFERTAYAVLGSTSYGIYAVHSFAAAAIFRLWPTVGNGAPWSGICLLCVLIVSIVWLDKYYDQPTRAFLKRAMR